MSRTSRKLEHLKYALSSHGNDMITFDDIHFVHQAISETSLKDISIKTTIGGLDLSSPIIINAMTGGADETTKINEKLAIIARETDIAIAVGSQMSAIKNPQFRESYQVVRRYNPNGIIFANLGAEATVEQALEAIEMIDATALQIHLNNVQELIMPEGDRNFYGTLERIERIKEAINIPLIVKEVGFGIAKETTYRLHQIGINIIDVGGKGGTNFAMIENKRRKISLDFFNHWGIPTPLSVLEVKSVNDMEVIATGGIRNSIDVSKAIRLGANATGIAGAILKKVINEDEITTINYIQQLHEELKLIMTALGTKDFKELQKAPIVLSSEMKNWCEQRDIFKINEH